MLVCFRFLSSMIIISLLWAASPVLAQSLEIESLMIQRQVNCILEQGEKVIGGLDGGGILIWDRQDPTLVTRMSAGEELSGNNISDLAWTGRYVWVATLGGGMTRIANLNTEPEYRQFTSNIGSMDITAVTGEVIGNSERVYYGMENEGLGVITDGLGGALYTAEQDGLIDNNINDLQIFENDLFIATPSGISRFANFGFTDQNNGLSDLNVTDLVLDPDGNLIAGGAGGVFIWDSINDSWSNLGGIGAIRGLSSSATQLWALGWNTASFFNGSTWIGVSIPHAGANSISAGQDVWVGGRWRGADMNSSTGLAWYGSFDGVNSFSDYVVDASLVENAYGVAFDHEGTVWSGSWTGLAVSGIQGDAVHNISQIATADNDSTGLFQYGSNMLTLAADHEHGLVYIGQFTRGVVRHDLNTGELDLMYGGTCGMEEDFWIAPRIITMTVHPDGTLLMMYDDGHDQKVRILTDPIHWRGDANWHDVPQGASGGIGYGVAVWDAVVQRNDVIWFAVEGTGLVRWDINGNSAGPDDELTWSDFSDDRWDGPFFEIDGTSNDPTQALTRLAVAPDGSIWFGGNGITRFSFDEVFGEVHLEEAFSAKTASYEDGLITGNVNDIEVDGAGNLWVATNLGLNRVHWETSEPEIDAFFDLPNYMSNSDFSAFYSPNVITGLSGGVYARLASNADGKRMAMTSDRGTVAWDVPPATVGDVGDESSLYCYPNPWTPDGTDNKLKIGGIAADDTNDDPALVEVYNLAGQLVYKNSYVSSDVGFWSGLNKVGKPVVTGLYLVRVKYRDVIAVRTVAVVR